MNKEKTTKELLVNYINNADSLQLAIIRSMLIADAQKVLNNKDEVCEEYRNSIISPEYVIWQAEDLLARIGY